MAFKAFLTWLLGRRKPKPSATSPIVEARKLVLAGQAPEDYSTRKLDLSNVEQPFTLPARLQCFELILAGSSVTSLPPGVRVSHRIDLSGCKALSSLPEGLKTGTLLLRDCTALSALPEHLDVHFLTLDDCRALSHWPKSARVTLGHVSARRCTALKALPASLGPITSLDISGCTELRSIPAGVQVTSWLDRNGTGIRQLPESLGGVELR